MSSIKDFFSKPINLVILITSAVVVVYFSMLIIKEIGFKSYDQKKIECLKMGSDFARRRCLLIIESKKTSLYGEYLKSNPQKDCGIYCDLIPSNFQENTNEPSYSKEEFDRKMDELQNSVQESIDKEWQKKADCESNGGSYRGGGLCTYY